jgi:hypothetical protein
VGAGRKPGSRNTNTVIMLSEIEKRGEQLPSQFMRSIMNDPEAPLVARIMCARGSIAWLERKPTENRLPVLRELPDAEADDWLNRQIEDIEAHPEYYDLLLGRVPLPPAPRKPFVPDPRRKDPSFAHFDVDYRGGSGKPWAPGEREELQELARPQGLRTVPNGEDDPDHAA